MSKYQYIDREHIDKIVVRTRDGKNYLAEYDSSGNLVPVRMVNQEQQQFDPSSMENFGQGRGKEEKDGQIAQNAEEALSDMHSSSSTAADVLKRMSEGDAEMMKELEKKIEEGSGYSSGLKVDPKIKHVVDDNVFRARLSSIMTDNKYDRRVKGRRRGKLDMTRLFKVKAKSESVFTRKESRKNKNYNIVLVVDESGSMRGTNIQRAGEICTFLAKSIHGLNVNLAVVGFNHFVMVHKEFDETVDFDKMHKEIVKRATSEGSGCNHDYDALSKAYDMLKGRDGENIVIFMSDGAPATCTIATNLGMAIKYPENPVYSDWLPVAKVIKSGKKYRELTGQEVADLDSLGGHYKAEYFTLRKPKEAGKKQDYEMYYQNFDGPVEDHNRDTKIKLNALVVNNESLAQTIGIGIKTESWQVPDNFSVKSVEEMKPLLLQVLNKKIRRG